MFLDIVKNGMATAFVIEECALEGVKRIASKVANDVFLVSDVKPEEIIHKDMLQAMPEQFVLFATIGESKLVDELVEKNKFDKINLMDKREVYQIQLIENPFDGVEQILLVCGSDKRGTIYGMFGLSEYIGVSPLYFWGDVAPQKKILVSIGKDIETISKEPSIKYRGFFINDEWPCFGNWTVSHYDGFTSKMYDNVFELLLRLKGNYLWPAMWSSSFSLDGPGSLNEELADIYGVVIGYSHHEPCLRASEEWDKVRGEGTKYGNEWNFWTNEKGLLNYWEDGLKRSGKYENIVTIGMRGERDTSMLGKDASLKDNIELLKDIIKKQRNLIKEQVNPDLNQVPQLLALYKEVEAYYYGDANTPGLKDWNELDGVICMLCEDNFGHMRTLPTEDIRNRKGGFGMYYHFDYHGDPISYEWVTSTPFTKVWEQMTMAYDYGIQDVWIVNVGDLKFNEVPLAYFLSLAYDFEKLGTSARNTTREYTKKFIHQNFPTVTKEIQEKIEEVLKGYIDFNGLRRPEALHAGIYHPCNYLETDRILEKAFDIEQKNEIIYDSLNKDQKEAYYSLIYYPAKASINLLKMHLYAGKNTHYVKQGKTIANEYAVKVTECIKIDKELIEEFGNFKNGKWDGMQLAQHIGFTKWNEDNYRYPIRMEVEPAHKPRMTVSRKDDEKIAVKNYGAPTNIIVDDFIYEGQNEVILEIANDGIGEIKYSIEIVEVYEDGVKVEGTPDWFFIDSYEGTVEKQSEIKITCDRTKLSQKLKSARLLIKDAETVVAVTISGKANELKNLEPMTFLNCHGIVSMNIQHYCKKHDTAQAGFELLEDYGKTGFGMKVYPTTLTFKENEEKPSLSYRFQVEKTGEYVVEVHTAPTNSVVKNQGIHYLLTDKNGNKNIVTHIPSDFRAGFSSEERWAEGVLNQEYISKSTMYFTEGVEEITIGAMEAGLVIEKIMIYPTEITQKKSYLGPVESYFTV